MPKAEEAGLPDAENDDVVAETDGHKEFFEQMQKWDATWDITRRLLELADVESLAELSHVQGDSSDGEVAGGDHISGGHYMPSDMTEQNEHGETVPKTES